MEFIPTSIKIIQNAHNPDGSFTEITFNSDCTEQKFVPGRYGGVGRNQNIKTEDDSQDMIFPKLFTDLFQVLFTPIGNNMFQNDNHLQNNGSTFLQYIFKSMVVPFTKLEKENHQLRNKLERKDQQLKQLQEQLERKDQELKEKDETQIEQLTNLRKIYQELEKTKAELEEKVQQYRQELLTASTLKFSLEAKEEVIEEKDQELEQLREKLEIKYHDYLLEVQEEFEEKDQRIEDLKEKLEEKDQDFQAMQEELEIKYEDYLQLIQEELEEKDQELKDAQEELKRHGRILKTCIEELKTHIEEVEKVEEKNQVLEHLNHRLICETSSFVERKSYFSPEM